MDDQKSFDWEKVKLEAPFVRGSETSEEAAKRIEPVAGTQRAAIMALLREQGPMTDDAIQAALGIPGHSECPRRGELLRLGLIQDSGRKALTRTGRKATVWELA